MASTGAGYDLSPTTFSPDGRIFQVEYATKAVENSGTVVGIRCADGVVLGVEKVMLSKMLLPSSNRRVAAVAPHAGQSGSQITQVSSSSGGIGPEHRGALGAGDVATVAAALALDGSAAEHYNGKLASPTLWREALDLSLLSATVSRRIIAGIWVAFFQECQQ